MTLTFHLLRPFWLCALLPWAFFTYRVFLKSQAPHAWSAICDPHLQPFIIQMHGRHKHSAPLLLLASALFMIISLTGPTWSRLPVPAFQKIQPRVLLLDMSDSMLETDLLPDRIHRAKFKLHDLFKNPDVGQFALIAYTSEPFVVSPLTDDGQIIESLLPSLLPNTMPVGGNRLDRALEEGGELIAQAGFHTGQILVLTAQTPSPAAMNAARKLANKGIYSSILPVRRGSSIRDTYAPFATAGQGHVILFSDTDADINTWLTHSKGSQQYGASQHDMPVWRDEGRWFLIPALLLLLPAFRRGWLQRINT